MNFRYLATPSAPPSNSPPWQFSTSHNHDRRRLLQFKARPMDRRHFHGPVPGGKPDRQKRLRPGRPDGPLPELVAIGLPAFHQYLFRHRHDGAGSRGQIPSFVHDLSLGHLQGRYQIRHLHVISAFSGLCAAEAVLECRTCPLLARTPASVYGAPASTRSCSVACHCRMVRWGARNVEQLELSQCDLAASWQKIHAAHNLYFFISQQADASRSRH